MTVPTFDFESGDLSLDFANTKEWHASANPTEHIPDYSILLVWGIQAGLIDEVQAEELRRQALQEPEKAIAFYERAIELREALYRIFSRRYAGEPVAEEDLVTVNKAIREAMGHLQLVPVNGALHWDWAPGIDGEKHLVYSVARAAANLLASDQAERVRECEDDRGCGYLFIDQSKNHSRRWCSMESCGNRAKARRHYERLK